MSYVRKFIEIFLWRTLLSAMKEGSRNYWLFRSAKTLQRWSTALIADPRIPNLICKARCSPCCWASPTLQPAGPLSLSPHTFHGPKAFLPRFPLAKTPHFSLKSQPKSTSCKSPWAFSLHFFKSWAFLGLFFPAGAKYWNSSTWLKPQVFVSSSKIYVI